MVAGVGLFICVVLIVGLNLVAKAATIDLADYRLTFDEDFRNFDVSALGPGTRWIAHTPWNGDFGEAAFDNPGPDGPFKVGAEGLQITARKDAQGRWHSGLICSMDRDGPGQHGFAQRYGYFEMRAKLPSGPGVWPAFWLIGTDKSKTAAEIDVVEYYGAFPRYYHNWAHVFLKGRDVLLKDNLVSVGAGSLSDSFNTFGVLIEPELTTFFLNRREVWKIATPAEYRQPVYLLADLALGGGWPIDKAVSPAVMTISNIRVFASKTSGPAGP